MSSDIQETAARKLCMSCHGEFPLGLTICPRDGTPLSNHGQDTLVGTVFDSKYEILEVIGRGGMGLVYRAKHLFMNRMVAIKVLHKKHITSADALKRFQIEAQTASTLSIPNIVTIFDFGISPMGEPFMVMDFVDGRTLQEIVDTEGSLSLPRALHIFTQLSNALGYAHGKGILHRDIKPSNIMLVSTDGQPDFVKIVDFGIVKLLNSSDPAAANLTRAGEVFGSPLYMSPEQCQGQKLDARADIYSLGSVMYRAISGTPIYQSGDVLQLMAKHVTEMPASFRSLGVDVPAQVEAIIFKTLAKDPDQRYQSMTELAIALGQIGNSLSRQQVEPVEPVGTEAAIATAARIEAPSPARAPNTVRRKEDTINPGDLRAALMQFRKSISQEETGISMMPGPRDTGAEQHGNAEHIEDWNFEEHAVEEPPFDEPRVEEPHAEEPHAEPPVAQPHAKVALSASSNNRSVFTQHQDDDVSDIARRVAQMTVSAIKQMPILAEEIGGCVSLGQGIPSFNTPDFILDAMIKELQTNPSIGKYTMQPGLPALKQAVADDLKRTRGLPDVNAERELFISCGGMEALAAGLATIVERGDEVILPSPTYSSHIEQVLFAEGQPRFVPLLQDGWQLDLEAMRDAITDKTKAIVLCNPVNPTGTIFSEAQLRAVADLVIEHDLFLVMDEAYDFLLYDGCTFFSPLSMPEMKEHVIGVCSFSKRYCMTGWRVGFMYACERIIRQVLKVHDAFAICAPTISQYAALAALRETNGKDGIGDRSVQELIDALEHRRNLVCNRLDELPDLFQYVKPHGGYYIFPQISLPETSIEFALRLLKEARVITIPGSAFGPSGEGYIRMSFGATVDELHEAFDRIKKFWQNH